MEEKSITSQESLDLIARMIRNTQDRFERGAGKPFLVFGYLTVAVSLAVWYAMATTGDYHWNWLWFIIPVVGGVIMLPGWVKSQKPVTTFIDRAVGQVWMVLAICALGLSLFTMLSGKYIPILLVMSLLVFAGEAITGGIIRLNYVKVMGIAGIILSFGLPYLTGIEQILGFGGLFLVAMVIPGHIMNAQARRANRQTA